MVLWFFEACKEVKHRQEDTVPHGLEDTDSEECDRVVALEASNFGSVTNVEDTGDGFQMMVGNALVAMKVLADSYYKQALPRRRLPLLPSNRQTLMFFDWDDTLLCTTFLQDRLHEMEFLNERSQQKIQDLCDRVESLLLAAQRLGRVLIVTNAQRGWVEASTLTWMPRLLPLLATLPVMSARSTFETEHPGNQLAWKVRAFAEFKKDVVPGVLTNVICFGDSPWEHIAARELVRGIESSVVKCVKFRSRPSPSTLCDEIEIISRELSYIEKSSSNLNLSF